MTLTSIARAGILDGLDLPLVRMRITMRLLEDAYLPHYKGGMLRGGFGYAFQRASCPQACWRHSESCAVAALCPYRWVFETPHPPGVAQLHDLQDVPRPFVIEPPLDRRTDYRAGEALEFGLLVIGRGIEQLAYFLYSFEQLGRMGLGVRSARAQLERVEALAPWRPTGRVIYQDGRVIPDASSSVTADRACSYDSAAITARAAALPADLQLILRTPLRVKAHRELLRSIELPALVQAACWRLSTLATFHGGGPWAVDHHALIEQARAVTVERARVEWVDWERTSTRGAQPQKMTLGGLIGEAVLRSVPPEVCTVLLAGSLVHVGKACVFGHGEYMIEAAH